MLILRRNTPYFPLTVCRLGFNTRGKQEKCPGRGALVHGSGSLARSRVLFGLPAPLRGVPPLSLAIQVSTYR